MNTHFLTRPSVTAGLAVLASAWLITDLRFASARLLCLIAFLVIAPGGAAIGLLFPEQRPLFRTRRGLADDAATVALLVMGLSIALDTGVAQAMVWLGAWDPTFGVLVLAALTIAMAAGRARQRRARPGVVKAAGGLKSRSAKS